MKRFTKIKKFSVGGPAHNGGRENSNSNLKGIGGNFPGVYMSLSIMVRENTGLVISA